MLLCVGWYLRYSLSYRDLEEIMFERGLHVDHTTISRWVQRYTQELEKRCRPHLKATNDCWRLDETSIQVKKTWMYLYRTVDSEANTLEGLLSPTRDAEAAKRLFFKTLGCSHTVTPHVLTVEKNAAYPKALGELKAEGIVPQSCERTSASTTSIISSNKIIVLSSESFCNTTDRHESGEGQLSGEVLLPGLPHPPPPGEAITSRSPGTALN